MIRGTTTNSCKKVLLLLLVNSVISESCKKDRIKRELGIYTPYKISLHISGCC